MTIIGKRYEFLFEDVWFILLQYLFFEKFVVNNALYLSNKAGEFGNILSIGATYEYSKMTYEYPGMTYEYFWKHFGFMSFNLIFTALCGLGGLSTIPFCFKMIKQRKTKTKIFYILTIIQILLQIIFPFMRAVIVILQVLDEAYPEELRKSLSHCILVGFQVYSFGI